MKACWLCEHAKVLSFLWLLIDWPCWCISVQKSYVLVYFTVLTRKIKRTQLLYSFMVDINGYINIFNFFQRKRRETCCFKCSAWSTYTGTSKKDTTEGIKLIWFMLLLFLPLDLDETTVFFLFYLII